jgi:hypothetical protein
VLIFEASVSHLAEAVKEYGTGQSVLGLALVQSDLNAATEFCVLQPLQGEERSFDTAELARARPLPTRSGVGRLVSPLSAVFDPSHDRYFLGRAQSAGFRRSFWDVFAKRIKGLQSKPDARR